MPIRRNAARALGSALGDARLTRLKNADRRVRRATIRVLDIEKKTAAQKKADATAGLTKSERRLKLIEQLGDRDTSAVVHQEDLKWASSDPLAPHPKATLSRHKLLDGLHRQLRPRTYFEIGVRFGASLSLSRARSIGVDPAYSINAPLHCDLQTFQTTSDEFFQRPDAFDHFEGTGIDLAFIDGMHLSEFVLRDFINAEAHAAPGCVFVLDDVLPRNNLEAYRVRRTGAWAGDVYKVIDVLAQYRPDLTLVPLNTRPTGTLMIAGLDPGNTALADSYDSIEADLLNPDPQVVPRSITFREIAVDPHALLSSDVLPRIADLRANGAGVAEFAEVFADLDDLPRYGPNPVD